MQKDTLPQKTRWRFTKEDTWCEPLASAGTEHSQTNSTRVEMKYTNNGKHSCHKDEHLFVGVSLSFLGEQPVVGWQVYTGDVDSAVSEVGGRPSSACW